MPLCGNQASDSHRESMKKSEPVLISHCRTIIQEFSEITHPPHRCNKHFYSTERICLAWQIAPLFPQIPYPQRHYVITLVEGSADPVGGGSVTPRPPKPGRESDLAEHIGAVLILTLIASPVLSFPVTRGIISL